eukprot:8630336-Alexandrium_andersonii.AAC.1
MKRIFPASKGSVDHGGPFGQTPTGAPAGRGPLSGAVAGCVVPCASGGAVQRCQVSGGAHGS